MNLIDSLDLYSQLNDSDDMFLMLKDYTLDSRIDREMLNRIIVKDLGNLRPITTNTRILKMLIEEFFNKYNYNIMKLLDTMYINYDPLTNKNITETEHRESTGDIDNTDTYHTDTGVDTEDTVSAYNETTYQPKAKKQQDGTTDHSGTTTSDIRSDVDTNKTVIGKDSPDTYQSLIEQERKLADFNIFVWIIKHMRKELFLMVY